MRPTVKIGLVAPFEGRYRYVGYDVIYAARLAVRKVNAAGGVGGYAVELVAYDDGADPAAAIEQAHKLIVDPDVLAVIGHFRAETTAAAADDYTSNYLPLLTPVTPSDDVTADALLSRIQELGCRRVALIAGDSLLGESLQRAARAREIALDVADAPEDVAAGAEAAICAADPVTAGEWLAALRAAGWRGLFLGGAELAAVDFTAVAGEAAGGAEFVTPWPLPVDGEIPAAFEQSYRDASGGLSPGPLAFPTYEATWALFGALEREIAAHGKPTRAGLAAVLADYRPDEEFAPLYWYSIGVDGKPHRSR